MVSEYDIFMFDKCLFKCSCAAVLSPILFYNVKK